MDYIHHDNGTIGIAPRNLPRSWRNVSGLDRATPAELKAMGWLPVNYVGRDYDAATQIRSTPVGGQIGDPATGNSVNVTYTVRNKTAQELSDERNARADDILNNNKALVAALNDGSFIPGSNYTDAQMRNIIKDKM